MSANENMRVWNAVCKTDPDATKPITGKPYRGTSVNGTYVAQRLTEAFGPAGKGWGVKVLAEATLPGVDGEVLHVVRVWLWAHGDQTCGFEGYGQTMLVAKTKNGLKLDEDAPKKSLTDAMTKAASWLGVCADIYLGRWDDSRYVDERRREEAEAKRNGNGNGNGHENGSGKLLPGVRGKLDVTPREDRTGDEQKRRDNSEGVIGNDTQKLLDHCTERLKLLQTTDLLDMNGLRETLKVLGVERVSQITRLGDAKSLAAWIQKHETQLQEEGR